MILNRNCWLYFKERILFLKEKEKGSFVTFSLGRTVRLKESEAVAKGIDSTSCDTIGG